MFVSSLRVISFAVAALAAPAAASVIYVDENAVGPVHDGSSWCSAYTTLYDALAVAAAGDTIRVAGGLYTPRPVFLGDPRSATFDLVAGVRIEGAYAGCGAPNPDARDYSNDTSYIRGDPARDDHINGNTANNSYHVLTLTPAGDGAVLDGLYVDGGKADEPFVVDGLFGAGLLASDASLSAINCIFQGLEAIEAPDGSLGRGGSVYARRSKLEFVDCLFRESIAGEYGGGIYSEASSIVYSDCMFAACITGGSGGGMFNDGASQAHVVGGTFLVCRADAQGGGMRNHGATVFVARTRFSGSDAKEGGAVYDHKTRATFVNCDFTSFNQASNHGGCIYGNASPTTLINCRLAANQATNLGGGIVHANAKLVVSDCTIADNSSGSGAAGIELVGTAAAVVTNTILWNNASGGVTHESAQIRNALGATLSINFCDVQGWSGALGGVGNFGLDPLFVAPSGYDHHLALGSPCRNSGNAAALPSDVADLDGDGNLTEPTPLDLDLALRVQGPALDLGAYEAP